mmetsp:Transcript_16495/g.43121  ORF Transcript_16495/g.43121 Transcript_16495/m.43121 type:complete len:524 (+) Transcript_16495:40-1611(+)
MTDRLRITPTNGQDAGEQLIAAEKESIPLLISKAASSWPACKLWSGKDGLKRMRSHVAPNVNVSVMASTSDIFIGDLRQYTPTTCSFHEFLDEANAAVEGCEAPHLYLAQQELRDTGMAPLLLDVETPACLQGRAITSVNLWMCIRGSRSNIHYDPYSNLLVVVTGSKHVTLFSPACTPFLAPAALTSDAANHSQINFTQPDFDKNPEFRLAKQQQTQVTMQAGDALFIPEGYWHQVDSEGVTVAVNFWWQSTLTTVLREQPHCRFYHLRVVMGEALGSLIEQLVENCPAADLGSNAGGTLFPYSQLAQLPETSTEMSAACRLSCLTPREVAAVSLTCTLLSRCPDAQQAVVRSRPGPEQESSHMERTPVPKILNGCSSSRNGTGGAVGEWQNPLQLPADPLSCLFRALDTAELVHCLYEVSVKQPSLIQTMFDVHMTPLAAYLFTSKLESAERECVFSNECASEQTVAHDGPSQTLSQAEFYCSLYGACRDPDQVFHQLLDLRQQLSQQAAEIMLKHVVRMF